MARYNVITKQKSQQSGSKKVPSTQVWPSACNATTAVMASRPWQLVNLEPMQHRMRERHLWGYLTQTHSFLSLNQHALVEGRNAEIWAGYPNACVVIQPNWMKRDWSSARKLDARLSGWVHIFTTSLWCALTYWLTLCIVSSSVCWIQGCMSMKLDL